MTWRALSARPYRRVHGVDAGRRRAAAGGSRLPLLVPLLLLLRGCLPRSSARSRQCRSRNNRPDDGAEPSALAFLDFIIVALFF